MGDTPTATALEVPKKKNLNLIMSLDIRDHFPFNKIRQAQEIAFTAIEQARKEHKKYVVLELPTGAGKSGVGIGAGSWAKTWAPMEGFLPGAYYLSPQKTLTKQAMGDFGDMGLMELKGQSNYLCNFNYPEADGGEQMDCETASFMHEEAHKQNCSGYKPAKRAFCSSPLGITNFAYYLAETTSAGQLEPRSMMILDEAHGTEEHILNVASIELTRYRCEEVGIDFSTVPYIKSDAEGMGVALDWLNQTFRPACVDTIIALTNQSDEQRNSEMFKTAVKTRKKAKGLERFVGQLDMFLKSEERKKWMVWSESEVSKCPHCRAKLRPGTVKCWRRECGKKIPLTPAKMIIKPLTATLFANDILFKKAQMVVLMSATILDFNTFLRNLGIHKNDAVCVALDSEFPIENRLILYHPVGNMSAKTIDETLPKMAAEVEKLLNKHNNDKGIIHTHTYKITRYLVDYLRARGYGKRILTHEEGIAGDRERIVAEHSARVGEPTVIISPSMTEGLDLKDDLSRFSIVVKVPYAFLSNYIKARMEIDPDWYAWKTALMLEQATGRSNRHMDDKAIHYILDEAFGYFVNKNGSIFSKWWSDSIQFPGDFTVDW